MSRESQDRKAELAKVHVDEIWASDSIEFVQDKLNLLKTSEYALEASSTLIAISGFKQLKQITVDEISEAEPFILGELFEWCCKPSGDDQPITESQARELREILEEWLYQYSPSEYQLLRKRLLSNVGIALKENPSNELLSTVARIGYRTEAIWKEIEDILKDEGSPLFETALSTTAWLGVPPEKLDGVLDLVSASLAEAGPSRSCQIAIQELPGPKRTELALGLLQSAEKFESDSDGWGLSLAYSVVSKVAVRSPNDSELHSSIWGVFRKNYDTIRMTPSFANSCNTALVTQDHLDWYLEKNVADSNHIGAYLSLSRLSELTSERQLEGWPEDAPSDLEKRLRQDATLDTEIDHGGTTTELRLKRHAWEVALSAQCKGLHEWIDTAILDETNANVANDISKIAACIRPHELSDRFLEMIRTEPIQDDSEWTRHLGMIEVAKSCADRNSFDAILDFGLTHKGEVLLSTVDAIADCAIERIREGDADALNKVLAKADGDSKQFQQKAAVSAFCKLVNAEVIAKDETKRLWDYAFDDSRDEYSRCRSLESIGLSLLDIDEAKNEKLTGLAAEPNEIGWRACEVMVKKKLIKAPYPEWFLLRVGLDLKQDESISAPTADVSGWQAYLIGLLFRESPDLLSQVVSQLIAKSSSEALYQLFGSLEFMNSSCPDSVGRSLVSRIVNSNNVSRTDTELFRVLRNVSERKLLTLATAADWRNWLPVGRASLCEMIGSIAVRNPALNDEATSTLLEFAKDASFRVRRSAYRAISKSNPRQLAAKCELWGRTGDVELRKRGAEACTWLPQEYSDEFIQELGFRWDEEPSVREVFKGTTQRRRRLDLAHKYLERVLDSCQMENGVLATYRYGRAIESLGDDETIALIQNFLDENELASHVRHYLRKIQKGVRKNWKGETKKWREPWSHEAGIVEEVQATLYVEGKGEVNATVTLRCRHKKNPSDLGSWSARAVTERGVDFFKYQMPDEPIEIRIPGRDIAKAYVFGLGSQDGGTKGVLTLGGGVTNYPKEPRPDDSFLDLQESVASVLTNSDAKLVSTDAEVAKSVHALIESAKLSHFEFQSGEEKQVKAKQACQTAAILLSAIVEFFVDDEKTSVLLWRIANAVLENESLTLRLSPSETTALQAIARHSEQGSPDELLFWLMERIEAQAHTANVVGGK